MCKLLVNYLCYLTEKLINGKANLAEILLKQK